MATLCQERLVAFISSGRPFHVPLNTPHYCTCENHEMVQSDATG